MKYERIVSAFSEWFTSTADLICPPLCVFCKSVIEREHHHLFFCEPCQKKFALPMGKFCIRCGSSTTRSQEESARNGCHYCNQFHPAFCRSFVLGEYGFELRKAILQMKTDQGGILAINMARLFLRERVRQILDYAPEIVVPVPMHFLRRFHRGVNSPVVFAREVAETLNVSLGQALIRRTRYTKPQFKLNEQQRRKNVQGAFAFSGNPKKIRKKRILLIDDIMTTGATCHEIASVLLNGGAESVAVAVFARAEGQTFRKKGDSSGK